MTVEIFRDDAYAQRCEAVIVAAEGGGVALDRTVFYAAGGGQPGDSGTLICGDGRRLAVVDTRKYPSGILHLLAEGGPLPAVGGTVTAEIDWPRRHRLMRMHSALHLLCRAIESAVTGGQVGPDKGRLDFDLPEGGIDKEALADRLNQWVEEDHVIRSLWIDAQELASRPELVRTMSVQPPVGQGRVRLVQIEGLDLQACGGTHVRSTGEIGRLQVGKVENKGRRNRRVTISFADAEV